MLTADTRPLINQRWITSLLATLLVLAVTAIGVLAYTPPVSRDALTQHLVIPKRYLAAGKIHDIPQLPSSYNPMNLDLLYMIPLYLGNDILAKYIHFLFALLTGGLIFACLRQRFGKEYGYLGALLFLSTPIIVKLSTTVYVDLGLIFFSFAALLYLFKWREEPRKPRYLWYSAALCGLSMGTKYNGLIGFFLLTMFVPLLYMRMAEDAHHRSLRATGHGLAFATIALAVFSPWMIRDALWTGNPLYPLFDTFFNPGHIHATTLGHFAVRNLVFHESWWQILTMPVRLFFQGQDGNPQFFDGRLNAALFILPWFALLPNEAETAVHRTEKQFLLAYAILFLLFAFLQTDLRARYVGPILPPLVLLSVFGLRHLLSWALKTPSEKHRRSVVAILVASILAIVVVPNATYVIRQFSIIKPFTYLRGAVDRDTYIQGLWPEYAADRYINTHLPKDAKVLGFFMGERAYYVERNITFDIIPFKQAILSPAPVSKIFQILKKQNITHFLIRMDLFEGWTKDNLDPTRRTVLRQFLAARTTPLFYQDGFAVVAIE